MGSGEKLCVGCVTAIDGQVKAHKSIRPGVLTALYGAAAVNAEAILDQAFSMLNLLALQTGIKQMVSPFVGLSLGPSEQAHADQERDLVQIALLMSSSVCNMSDPGQLDATDVASDGGKRVNHQFITRVKTQVTAVRPDLAAFFNAEARLLANKRPVRFGFLSDKLVAHLGLLQPVSLNSAVRNARGLMQEVHIAHVARDAQGQAALLLGHPPLTSPDLSTKDREAISDSLYELKLEAAELKVNFRAADNDEACARELIAFQ